ncbi:MAG: hypothetical protein K9I59_05770 [Chlorobium sp.]|jgi:hypothetical protein|uniref:hypothetical protein n=1 Tax=Chlorobium sp. TaxID=1095 RepID=UPI001E138E17|nr:hypothetical protein [Chlorobium sp.]MBN1278457.1 hypothetical protein [Chlorobiaceae bacterium]MCF8216273.1 hypothetical protein [Chlorobium sp.]MCF8271175.1 hypothetical protein [Chlorobium sp.]MCF8287561.1 hypothetical protein [Chlorobium sp.]MCF8291088.1 hypothetical protein [Chlorobium sp.]
MAEEIKTPAKGQQSPGGDAVKGDFSTILVGVGTLLDSTLTPLSKMVAQALDSLTVVAKQILEGVSSSLGDKK